MDVALFRKQARTPQGLSCWLTEIQTPLVESKEQEGLRAPCTQWYIYMNMGRKSRAKGSIHLKTLRGDSTFNKAPLQHGWGAGVCWSHHLPGFVICCQVSITMSPVEVSSAVDVEAKSSCPRTKTSASQEQVLSATICVPAIGTG